MRIAICDDDRYAMESLMDIIRKWIARQTRRVEIERHSSPDSFLFSMEKMPFDVAFLDIKMDGMSGIDLAKAIRRGNTFMTIVFVTNYPQMALQGFNVQAAGYLPKPVREAECIEVLDHALETYKRQEKEVFYYEAATQTIALPKADILYFQSKGHYIKIVHQQVREKDIMDFRMSMSQLEALLPSPQFFRSHKSYIVNLYHVFRVFKDRILMSNGETLLLGKHKWAEINDCYRTTHMNTEDRGSIYCIAQDNE